MNEFVKNEVDVRPRSARKRHDRSKACPNSKILERFGIDPFSFALRFARFSNAMRFKHFFISYEQKTLRKNACLLIEKDPLLIQNF